MWEHGNLRIEIGTLERLAALNKVDAYIQELKKEGGTLLVPELMEMQKVLQWEIDHYTEINNSKEHRDFVEMKAAQKGDNYNWGETVKHRLSNYKAALSVISSVLNQESMKDLMPKEKDRLSEKVMYPFLCDASVLKNVHSECTDIFFCDEIKFIELVFRGDFKELPIKRGCITRVQFLVYKLSRYIGDEWYGQICISLGWTKSKCSRNFPAIEIGSHYEWGQIIENIIPKELFA